MTNEKIARFFNATRAFIQGNSDLRDPQVEGWLRTRRHFKNSSEHAILQISARVRKIVSLEKDGYRKPWKGMNL